MWYVSCVDVTVPYRSRHDDMNVLAYNEAIGTCIQSGGS
jgi:hypothetical protein